MTIEELKVLSLGYLSGADLLQYCPAQLLISQYNQDNNALQNGCNQAYAELASKLLTKYDLTDELKTMRQNTREMNIVGIASVLAVRRILGAAVRISDEQHEFYRWADKCIADIRAGQMNLLLSQPSTPQVASSAHLVRNSFSTLG